MPVAVTLSNLTKVNLGFSQLMSKNSLGHYEMTATTSIFPPRTVATGMRTTSPDFTKTS